MAPIPMLDLIQYGRGEFQVTLASKVFGDGKTAKD